MKKTIKLKQLALILGLSMLMTAVASLGVTWLAVDDELSELLYEDIRQQTELLSRMLHRGHIKPDELKQFLSESFIDDGEDTFLISVEHIKDGWFASNLEIERSYGSSDSGVTQLAFAGHIWKGYQLRDGNLLIKLLRRDDMAADIKGDVIEDALLPVLIGNVFSLLILMALLSIVTSPLSKLVRQIEQRKADDLTDFELSGRLTELQAISVSLNQLMQGIKSTLEREKRFASDVAHELRTPLATLKLELALPDTDLTAMRQEVDRLIRVVEQLMTLARIESGYWQQQAETLDLKSTLIDVCQRLEPRISAAGLSLSLNLQDIPLKGDSTLLGLLVENLLLNVIKHAKGATQVSLELNPEKSDFLVLKDDGPGISAEQRQLMLEPFVRLDQRREGLGLGLSICKQIAEQHGFILRLEDASPGLSVSLSRDAVAE